MANELEMSQCTMRNMVRGKLKYTTYKLQKYHALSGANKRKSVENCRRQLYRTADELLFSFVSSDVKFFLIVITMV